MAKRTQKRQQKKSFVLIVFSRILNCQRLPFPKEVNKTLSAITYHSRKLLRLNLIRKVGLNSGVYKANVSEKKAIQILSKNTKKIIVTTKNKTKKNMKYKRVHSIQFRLSLPRFDYWYSILPKYLESKKIDYNINKKNQIRIVMQHEGLDHIILLCRNCIIGYIPTGKDFISDDTELAMNMCRAYINKFLGKFSNYFGKDLRIKGEFKFKITRRHIAMMDSSIAKAIHSRKKFIEVWVEGKLRLISDISFFDELEAITNDKAVSDVAAVESFLKDVIENKDTLTGVKDYTDQEVKYILEKILMQNKCIEILKDSQDKTNEIISKMAKDKGFDVSDFSR